MFMRRVASTRALRCIGIAVALACMSGCAGTIIKSHSVDSPVLEPNRVYYFLPTGYAEIELISQKGSYALTATIVYLPDPTKLYQVSVEESILTDDDVTFETSQNGLLKFVSGKSKDQRGAIVTKAAELAVEIAKAVVADELDVKKTLLKVLIDPTDQKQKGEVNGRLGALTNSELKIDFKGIAGTDTILKAKCTSCDVGLKFRPLLPYLATVKQDDKLISSGVVLLPNEAPVLSLEVARASFVEKDTKITFIDGVLTKYEMTKPSQALGFMQIPIDIVKAITSIPSAMLQFKIDQTTKQTNLDVAQRQALEAQAALAAERAKDR